MFVFFLICAVGGGLSFLAVNILLFVFEIKIGGRYFKKRGKTIPVEDFIPHSVSSMLFWLTSFGLCGLLFCQMEIGWYFSVPFSICWAFLVNFLFAHFIKPLIMNIVYGKVPKGDKLSGTNGICTDSISGDGYGKIQIEIGGNCHRLNAISANDTDIDEGEEIVILSQEDGVCIVQKTDEIYDILKEDDSHIYI